MATWDLQASAGATGKSILWRGEYSPAVTYNPYDSVSYQGSSYICTAITIGVAPVPGTTSYPPPLATTGSRGSIAQLSSTGQTTLWARGDNSWQPMPAGSILQTQVGTSVVSGSTAVVIPSDNTPPLITEGAVFITVDITPLFANSKILVSVSGFGANGVASAAFMTVAICRVGVTNSFGSQSLITQNSNYVNPFAFSIVDTPGSIAACTYQLRYGPSGAWSAFIGQSGVAITIGNPATVITAQEIKV